MLKGGYKIIDLKGKSIDTDAEDPSITVAGIYDAIEGNYGKALMLSGLVLDTTEYADFMTQAIVSSDDFVIRFDVAIVAPIVGTAGSVAYKQLTIDDDDKVTYAAVTATIPALTE